MGSRRKEPDDVVADRLRKLEERVAELRRIIGIEDPVAAEQEKRTVLMRLRAIEVAARTDEREHL